jgi:hypothetical protein
MPASSSSRSRFRARILPSRHVYARSASLGCGCSTSRQDFGLMRRAAAISFDRMTERAQKENLLFALEGRVDEEHLPRRSSSNPSQRPGSRSRLPFSTARVPLIKSAGALDIRRYAIAPAESADRSGLFSRDNTTIPARGSFFRIAPIVTSAPLVTRGAWKTMTRARPLAQHV